jgi:hypothetical protein
MALTTQQFSNKRQQDIHVTTLYSCRSSDQEIGKKERSDANISLRWPVNNNNSQVISDCDS